MVRPGATIVVAHSEKQQARGTFKGTYGRYPLTAWCDNTGESLAVLLRPGNAGSNTAADHLATVDAAVAQVPARYRRKMLCGDRAVLAYWSSRRCTRPPVPSGTPRTA